MTKKQIIKTFIKAINPKIKVDFNTDEFYCEIENKKIGIVLSDECDEVETIYHNFLLSQFNENFNTFLMSILHEIGHIETYNEDDINEREMLYYFLQLDYTHDKFEEYNIKYFSIPAELNATTWGVNFYRNNKKLCKNFLKKYYSK